MVGINSAIKITIVGEWRTQVIPFIGLGVEVEHCFIFIYLAVAYWKGHSAQAAYTYQCPDWFVDVLLLLILNPEAHMSIRMLLF